MLQVTKRNGRIVVYDREKIVASIMRAHKDAHADHITNQLAGVITDAAISELAASNTVITTEDIRHAVWISLCRYGLHATADEYIQWKRGNSKSVTQG